MLSKLISLSKIQLLAVSATFALSAISPWVGIALSMLFLVKEIDISIILKIPMVRG